MNTPRIIYTKEQIIEIVKTSFSYKEVFKKVGFSHHSYKLMKDIKKWKISIKHFRQKSKYEYLKNTIVNDIYIKDFITTNNSTNKLKALCICPHCNKEFIRNISNLLRDGYHQSCGCKVKEYKLGNKSQCWTGYGEIPGNFYTKKIRSSKRRKILFNVSIEYLWDLFLKQNRQCALTGVKLYFGPWSKPSLTNASIDRIDSSKGYIEGNVWWVHKDINYMKSSHTVEKFIELCQMVVNYNQNM